MTDYDKALEECLDAAKQVYGRPDLNLIYFTFGSGYRFGVWQQMERTRKETKESANAFAFQSPTDSESNQSISTQFCPSYDQNTPENGGLEVFLDPKISEKAMRADFAKAAMAALIQREPKTYHYQRVAQIAVNFADALIKELNTPKE